MSVSKLGEAALELAAAGHPVLPLHTPLAGGCSCANRRCSRIGKHPRGIFGLTHATTNLEQIETWWFSQPTANVGMRADGLVIFDCDGPDGRRSLEQLEWELGELPPSWGQASGRGEHRFYSVPPETLVTQSTHMLGGPPGLDLRAGKRGYVVSAPSIHASGVTYERFGPDLPAPLPHPWLERLLELPSFPPAGGGCRPVVSNPVVGNRSTRYGLVALERELSKIQSAPEGTRNTTLNKCVFRLAQLAAGDELESELIEREATAAALAAGLPAHEIDLTIHYALTAGFRFPRSRKPR